VKANATMDRMVRTQMKTIEGRTKIAQTEPRLEKESLEGCDRVRSQLGERGAKRRSEEKRRRHTMLVEGDPH